MSFQGSRPAARAGSRCTLTDWKCSLLGLSIYYHGRKALSNSLCL
nr:MAG TPA: hypothetical protein [Caudoviricetes sp.]